MTGPAAVLVKALRQAWLLAGVLAVITGLLGMHVLTTGHASHGVVPQAATAGQTAVAHSAVGDHAGHPAAAQDAPVLMPASCGAQCPGAQESGAHCVPSAPSGPVTVYAPQSTLAALPAAPAGGTQAHRYPYLPPSPTPCDLSISRT
jgi:hypothetical protein